VRAKPGRKLDMKKARLIRAERRPWREEPWKDWGISETMYKNIRANRAWVEFDKLGFFERMAA
jgi:hypothetical protein